MNFRRPNKPPDSDAAITKAVAQLKGRRAKAAERRRNRHGGFFDLQTAEVPKPGGPRLCSVPECGRTHKARGLCDTHYKASRRRSGKAN